MTRAIVAWIVLPAILAELCFAPFWAHRYLDAHPAVATTQTDLTAMYIPIYLAAAGIGLLLFKRSLPATPILLLILGAALSSAIVHYVIWGVASGRLLAPDQQTLTAFRAVMKYAFCISLLPPVLAALIRSLFPYAHRKT